MHIPDGFLTAPVWGSLAAVSGVGVAVSARFAQKEVALDNGRQLPMLGVMGAFVFAAQMVNFPVGMGTSGHLVGGTLLAASLGPWSASIVMTAVLLLQALVFQDGGVLALGANVCNMALAGVWAGYLPVAFSGNKQNRFSLFLGGLLSVSASAALALSELWYSGVRPPFAVLQTGCVFLLVTALIEGLITVVIARAAGIRLAAADPQTGRWPRPALAAGIMALLILAIALASQSPDALQGLLGMSGETAPWQQRALSGLGGMAILFFACVIAAWCWDRFMRNKDA